MEVAFHNDLATLYHGDCLEVMPTLAEASIDLIWTDPPYGHNNHDGDLNAMLNDLRGITDQPIANDGTDDMRMVVSGMLNQAVRVMNPKSSTCCCCCGGGGGFDPMFAWVASRLDREGLTFSQAVVWDKLNPGIGWHYRRQYEFVMVSHPSTGSEKWPNKKTAVPNVIRLSKPRNPIHPNEKPQGLVSVFVNAHTAPGDVVLDPFCGGGTTMIAALGAGRKVIGIELERKWVDATIERLKEWFAQPRFTLADKTNQPTQAGFDIGV